MKNLHDTIGFIKYLGHYEEAIREVYNIGNYHTNLERELVLAMDGRKGQIVKDVVVAIAAALPRDN